MKLNVNGADVEVDDRFAKSPLLWVLRDVLGMRGTKYGCGIGQCAACTVLIDGRNTKSCQTPAERAVGTAITTVEGASGPVVNAVRDAWHRGNVIQCGYCQGGQTLAVTALLETDRSPDDAAIGQWMNGNLCRCGTYALANFKLETTNVQTGVPIMVWRSVGNSHTEFARESAIDELAIAAGRDPVDLRRDLLAGNPRTLRALELAAEWGGWGSPLPEGRARGIACSSFLDSHSAQVTEISLDNRDRVHIEKITFALDCGITVNPDLVRAQVEGGLIYALGAAAWGEVVLGDGGQIITQNFDSYPVMRMQSAPQIEVLLIESGEPPTGVGEVSVPTAAPALTNAIAALTGTRIRRLPIAKTIRVY